MNEKINTILLAGDNFMPEVPLRLPGFTYSACGSITIHKERIQKFIKKREINDIFIKMS